MPSPEKKSLGGRLYLAVWRWHFWMGLLVAPVIIIASITGAIYVFKPELERVMYPELMFSDNTELQRTGFDDFAAQIKAGHPERKLLFVNVAADPTRNWEGFAEEHLPDGSEEMTRYFFDPVAGEITGTLDNQTSFFRVVLGIHRRLLAGTPGRLAVEIATCWGIVSVLTGLWLWWPRKKEKIWGVWLPRIRGGFRTVLRDWHTVPGVYIAFFALAIMVTGLIFTRVWGTGVRLGVFATGGFPEFFVDPPKSTMPDDGSTPTPIKIDDAVGIAFEHFDFSKDGFSLGLPHDEDNAIQVITRTQVPLADRGAVFLDRFSGDTLVFETNANLPWQTRALLAFYPIHVGSIFGLPTQIIAVIACLLLVAMSVTGVWLWWRRRPPGKFGEPRKPPPGGTPKWIVWVTVGLAFFLPTVGITLLLIFLGTWIGRRFKRSPAVLTT